MKNKPRAEIRTITPEWAVEVLERHSESQVEGKFRQRLLNDNTAKLYATDMKSGNWTLNGQGISFDEDGNLLDGQHRLAAVVIAKVAIPMLVMWDLPAEVNNRIRTIDTFDIGKKRSIGNQLAIDGFTYYSEIASAARLTILMVRGIGMKEAVSSVQGIAVANLMKNSYLKLIDLLKQGHAPKTKYAGRILAPLALLRSAEPDTADLFATEFNEMANLAKGSPILQFQKFMDRPSHLAGKGGDWTIRCMIALCSALYFYSRDEKCEIIKGNYEHMQWLLKVSKNAVNKIKEVAGIGCLPTNAQGK